MTTAETRRALDRLLALPFAGIKPKRAEPAKPEPRRRAPSHNGPQVQAAAPEPVQAPARRSEPRLKITPQAPARTDLAPVGREPDPTSVRGRVLLVLRANPERWWSSAELAALVGVSSGSCGTAVNALVRDRRADSKPMPDRKNQCLLYRARAAARAGT